MRQLHRTARYRVLGLSAEEASDVPEETRFGRVHATIEICFAERAVALARLGGSALHHFSRRRLRICWPQTLVCACRAPQHMLRVASKLTRIPQ